MSSPEAVVVVPCYDEAERFSESGFARFFDDPRVHLTFVDDGSRDATASVLARYCDSSGGRADLLRMPENGGKGEAVRAGMRGALDRGARIVGYTDADLATPAEEMLRMLELIRASDADAMIGARVALLGRDIERSAVRHYLGRVFATGVSLVLRERIYDTQCGAKLFRASGVLRDALADPFVSRWAFDVELLGRLMIEGANVVEVPLERWIDVPGSKLRPTAMFRAAADLVRIERDLERRRRRR
jgi:glycosyltransferase involved in cell wall biosynthesis